MEQKMYTSTQDSYSASNEALTNHVSPKINILQPFEVVGQHL